MFKPGCLVSWQSKNGLAQGQIKEIFTQGNPPLPVDMIASSDRPIALIEVWRDGKASGDFVGHPLPILKLEQDFLPVESAPTSVTADHLRLINQVAGAALRMKPIEAHEVVSVSFIAADNLVNRGMGKWVKGDLKAMCDLLIGLPFTLDHDWEEIIKSKGVIYDAKLVQGTGSDRALSRAGNYAKNRPIVDKEGYWLTQFEVAFPATSPIIEALRFGLAGAVSVGGFAYRDYWCPLCDTSFANPKCPHGLPDPFWGLTSDVDPLIAPYYIRKELYDMGEVSLVLIPNLPEAGIVKERL